MRSDSIKRNQPKRGRWRRRLVVCSLGACAAQLLFANDIFAARAHPEHASALPAAAVDPPPDFDSEPSSPSLEQSTSAGLGGLALNDDEKNLAVIFLNGAFEDRAAKIHAFDEAASYLSKLSPGRLLDLVIGLKDKGAVSATGNAGALFMQDASRAQKYRSDLLRTLLTYYNVDLTGDDVHASMRLADLIDEIQNSDLSEKAKQELVKRLEDNQIKGLELWSKAQDLHLLVHGTSRQLIEDVGIHSHARAEIQSLLQDLGVGDLFNASSPGEFYGQLLSHLVQTQLETLPGAHATLSKRVSNILELLRKHGQDTDTVLDRWHNALSGLHQLAKDNPSGSGEINAIVAHFQNMRWDEPVHDLNRNLEKLHGAIANSSATKAAKTSLFAELDRLKAKIGDRGAGSAAYFNLVSDLRNQLISSPEYQTEEAQGIIIPFLSAIEYVPGETGDAIRIKLLDLEKSVLSGPIQTDLQATLKTKIPIMISLFGKNSSDVLQAYEIANDLVSALQALRNSGAISPEDGISLSSVLFGYPGLLGSDVLTSMQARVAELQQQLSTVQGSSGVRQQLTDLMALLNESRGTQDYSQLLIELQLLRAEMRDHFPKLAGQSDALIAHIQGVTQNHGKAVPGELQKRLPNTLAALKKAKLPADTKAKLTQHAAEIDKLLLEHATLLDQTANYAHGIRRGFLKDAKLRQSLGPALTAKVETALSTDWTGVMGRLMTSMGKVIAKGGFSPSKITDDNKVKVVSHFEPLFREGIKQLENIADVVASSGQIKIWSKEYEAFFQILLEQYFRRVKLTYKKGMLRGLLQLPNSSGFMDQLSVLVQKSGPMLQKLLQVFSKEPSIGKEFRAVAEKLESGVETVPFEVIHEALLKAIPHLYPMRFKKFERTPLTAGTMAQLHRAEFIVNENEPDIVQIVAVRVIKPGIEYRVADDARVFQEIVPIVENAPEVKGSPLEKVSNFIAGIEKSVRSEQQTLPTAINQERGGRLYSRVLKPTRKGIKVVLSIGVPTILNQDSLDSGVHIMTFEKGYKLEAFFKHDPETYRQVAEQIALMWLQEALLGTGFFHMDMHQGNILARREADGSIHLTLLDFGMANTLESDARGAFMRLTAAMMVRNEKDILSAFNDLLIEPLPPGVLEEGVKKILDRPGSDLNALIQEVTRIGGRVPDSFVDFNRGIWLTGQTLAHAGSKETVDSLLVKLIARQLGKEALGRVGQSTIGKLDQRPDTGVPLTNRELGKIIHTQTSACVIGAMKAATEKFGRAHAPNP